MPASCRAVRTGENTSFGVGLDDEELTGVLDLFGTRVQDGHHDGFLVHTVGGGHLNDAATREQVGHRTRVGQRATVTGEAQAHVGSRTITVIRQTLHQEGDAVGAVAST